MNDGCETCNVPGPCNPRHIDCTLTDEDQQDVEMDRGDESYHAAVDRMMEDDRPS